MKKKELKINAIDVNHENGSSIIYKYEKVGKGKLRKGQKVKLDIAGVERHGIIKGLNPLEVGLFD